MRNSGTHQAIRSKSDGCYYKHPNQINRWYIRRSLQGGYPRYYDSYSVDVWKPRCMGNVMILWCTLLSCETMNPKHISRCTSQAHENSPHLHKRFAWLEPPQRSPLGPVQRVLPEETEEDDDSGEVCVCVIRSVHDLQINSNLILRNDYAVIAGAQGVYVMTTSTREALIRLCPSRCLPIQSFDLIPVWLKRRMPQREEETGIIVCEATLSLTLKNKVEGVVLSCFP